METKKEPKNIAPRLDAVDLTDQPKERKTTYSLLELLESDIEEVEKLFDPIFFKSGLAVMVGPNDAGKSTFLRQLAISVACGRDYLEWKYLGIHNRAYYFSSEDGANIVAPPLKRIDQEIKIPREAAENLLFEFSFDSETIADKVEERLKENPADLVVIDSLEDAFGGNLNDNTEVRKFYSRFQDIAERFDCLIIFNHHTSKGSSSKGAGQDNALGSTAIAGKVRLVIELRPDENETDLKHFCIVKCNYLHGKFKRKSTMLKLGDNFVFEYLGEGIDFAELAQKGDKQTRSKSPETISDERHKEKIIIASKVLGKEIVNQSEIKRYIELLFDVSDRTARRYIQYYIDKSWLIPGEKGLKNSVLYKINV